MLACISGKVPLIDTLRTMDEQARSLHPATFRLSQLPDLSFLMCDNVIILLLATRGQQGPDIGPKGTLQGWILGFESSWEAWDQG